MLFFHWLKSSPANKIKLFCFEHKADGHIDLENKISTSPGCTTRANYGAEETDLVLWCYKHQQPGNAHLPKLRCIEPGCEWAALIRQFRGGGCWSALQGAQAAWRQNEKDITGNDEGAAKDF